MAFSKPPYFGTVPWAERAGTDQTDVTAPLLEIRPGELDARTTALRRIFFEWDTTESWPVIQGLLGDLWAELELGLGSVDQARYLSTAEGRQLDELGLLVDLRRGALTDDEQYRLAIQARAASLFASGTIPELVEIIRALLDDQVQVTELWPASVWFARPDIEVEIFLLLLLILGPLIPAGVAAMLSTWDSTTTAGWGSIEDPLEAEIPVAGAWSSAYTAAADGIWALWGDGQPIGEEG